MGQAGAGLVVERDLGSEIDQFRRFIQTGYPSWILAFYGAANAARSTLLRYLEQSLPTRWLPIHLDFQDKTLREDYECLVRALSDALRAGGLSARAWSTYERRVEQVRLLKQVQVKMDMKALDGSEIVRGMQDVRLGEADELRVLEAARELAHAWLELVEPLDAKPIAFVDHWENLLDGDSKELATWLFEDLLGRLHLWRPDFRLVIASDRPLRRDWLLLQRVRSEEVMEWEVRS